MEKWKRRAKAKYEKILYDLYTKICKRRKKIIYENIYMKINYIKTYIYIY